MKKRLRSRKLPVFAEFIKNQLTTANIKQDAEADSLHCKCSTLRGYFYRNAFPQRIAIDLYLRYASKKLTPEHYYAQPKKDQERLTGELIRKIESQFSIHWGKDKKQHRQSRLSLPHSLPEAFATLDKQRGKCDEYLKKLGNQALFLLNSLQAGDFVVFLGADAFTQHDHEPQAWQRAFAGALNRKAKILFLQPCPQSAKFKTSIRLKSRSRRSTLQAFQEFKLQLQSQISDPSLVDSQMDHYWVDTLPFSMTGFSISLFGTTRSADEQLILRCCIRFPGDRLGSSILYPSYAPMLRLLESQIYLTLLSQRKTLVKNWKSASGKKKLLLASQVKLNESILQLFDGPLLPNRMTA